MHSFMLLEEAGRADTQFTWIREMDGRKEGRG
jgi:hypothetical protein